MDVSPDFSNCQQRFFEISFFDSRNCFFGNFFLGGNVRLAGAAFDADDFVAIAARDFRFVAIKCRRLADGVHGF
jgi:hypothetical protein